MSRLDDLPPDQRATLSLLLGQRKSYAEVAALLGLPEGAVHDRAHAALAVLAPLKARELTAERRESIGEYLLGQQTSVADRLATRTYLDASAPARAWANAISTEIVPLSSAPLPEIPQPGSGRRARGGQRRAEPDRPRAASQTPGVEPAGPTQPISRLGGALLLAGILVAVIVAIILVTSGGGGGSHATTSAGSSANASSTGSTKPGDSTTSKGSTGSGGPTEEARLTLTLAGPLEQSDRRRGDPRRRQQTRLLPGRRTPAPDQRLLLRHLAVQLADAATWPSARAPRSAHRARCREAPCCRPMRANTTRCCSRARRANGQAIRGRSYSAARSVWAARRHELARVHDPGGVEL